MLDQSSSRVDDVRLQSFSVAYDYPVVFTQGAFGQDNRCLADVLTRREAGKRHRFAVFVDDRVISSNPDLTGQIAAYAKAHAGHAELIGVPVAVAGGEASKNDPEVVPRLLSQLSELAIDRHSYAIAIGGGAVLDAVGYAASIFHRGVRHVRFPTTVLAQCDSGVGVKNAVNSRGLKNLIGTFSPPWAIINDSDFLETLPPREKRAGMAEAVKVALIRDHDFFLWLEDNAVALARFSPPHLNRLIKSSAELHMRQIGAGGDPFESGSARPLDFGHWSAHKLEQLTKNAISHGEAVGIGVALDARYSVISGLLAKREDERILRLLKQLGFVLWHDALKQTDSQGRLSLLQGLADFREHLGGELTITQLAGIGRGIEVHAMNPALIGDSIAWLAEQA
ncbi:3-dehydroquinate synthase [Mesorhizobium sp. M0664]|uniref:3-dehydroquinate synthase n=1 Tax=Mesorhizobium sp. M0664 TaxID=2956982 RepID=UPI0033360836